MAIDKIQSESINLADNFAFTGTVSGAGGVNTPAFEAWLSTDQSASNDTFTKLQCNTEIYDTDSDYDNSNYFIKSTFNEDKQPIQMIATFMERKFGAQNFYTPPSRGFTEYEETQNSLLAFTTTFTKGNLKIKPRVYWRRNQDEFLLRREDPSFFRNFHVSNKVGAEANASYTSNLGVTGFGLDLAKVDLRSNNLGSRNRFMATAFL